MTSTTSNVINLAQRISGRLVVNAETQGIGMLPKSGKLAKDMEEVAGNLAYFAERFRTGKSPDPERVAAALWRVSELAGDCADRARRKSKKLRKAKRKSREKH